MILPSTSRISHHHKVTNITMSPTSLSPNLSFSYSRRKIKQFYPTFHSKDLKNLYDTDSRGYNEETRLEWFQKANPQFNLTEFKIKAASPPTIVAATLSKIDLVASFTDRLTPFGVCKNLDLGKYKLLAI